MLQSLCTKLWRQTRPIAHPKSLSSARILFYHSFSSDAKDSINVAMDSNTGIATLTMQKPPVNSLNLEFLQSLRTAISSLEQDKCRGMFLTSALPTIFSAGLDIMEMYQPNMDRYKQFWTALQDMWLKLYTSPMATVAVINGHSPAGGCLLAMSCDYRVMVGPKFTIGLNETQLGIVAPKWFMLTMGNTISLRQTELALLMGRLFSTDGALSVGLIDETATNKDEALQKGHKQMKKLLSVPDKARGLTKNLWRESTVDWLLKNRDAELQQVCAFVQDPMVQKQIGLYLESLKKKN